MSWKVKSACATVSAIALAATGSTPASASEWHDIWDVPLAEGERVSPPNDPLASQARATVVNRLATSYVSLGNVGTAVGSGNVAIIEGPSSRQTVSGWWEMDGNESGELRLHLEYRNTGNTRASASSTPGESETTASSSDISVIDSLEESDSVVSDVVDAEVLEDSQFLADNADAAAVELGSPTSTRYFAVESSDGLTLVSELPDGTRGISSVPYEEFEGTSLGVAVDTPDHSDLAYMVPDGTEVVGGGDGVHQDGNLVVDTRASEERGQVEVLDMRQDDRSGASGDSTYTLPEFGG